MNKPTRTVSDIDTNYRKMVRVQFEGSPTWWPVLLTDVADILKSMGMIDGYDESNQKVWFEREIDSRFNKEYGNYEPIFRTESQDIRDFLRGCEWSEYNRIFSTVETE